jgi:hypothetical protein
MSQISSRSFAQESRAKDRVKAFWSGDEAFASTLLVMFVDKYGTEGLQWAPETIRMQVNSDFGVRASDVAIDRLLAAITIITSDGFFKNLPRFIQLCNILSGDNFDPEVFDPADSVECAWGITEALLLYPPDEDEPFVDEIRHYIGKVLDDEGYITPPDILRLAIGSNRADRVRTDFADDPEMFQAMYENQNAKAAEVTSIIRDNLTELMEQLKSLPLENGNTQELLTRVGKHLQTQK